jgi:hypothetical protein
VPHFSAFLVLMILSQGHDDFRVRDRATRMLSEVGEPALPLLLRFRDDEHGDVEVRGRCGMLVSLIWSRRADAWMKATEGRLLPQLDSVIPYDEEFSCCFAEADDARAYTEMERKTPMWFRYREATRLMVKHRLEQGGKAPSSPELALWWVLEARCYCTYFVQDRGWRGCPWRSWGFWDLRPPRRTDEP